MLCLRKVSLICLFRRLRSIALGRIFLDEIMPSLAFPLLFRTKKILKTLSATLLECSTFSKPSTRNKRYSELNLNDLGILYGKLGSTLGSTCVYYSSATPRFHANQKPVCALSLGYRRLVSSFHDCLFLINR